MFARGRAVLDVWVGIMGAMMAWAGPVCDELYLPVIVEFLYPYRAWLSRAEWAQ